MSESDNSSEVTLRQAKHDDFDAVMKIGDVYGGMDYLWYHYHDFLNEETADAMVAEAAGAVVAFQFIHVLDEGSSASVRASRVAPEWRGRGIYSRLKTSLRERCLATHPSLQRLTSATHQLSAEKIADQYKKDGFIEILRKRLKSFMYEKTDIVSCDWSKDDKIVFELSPTLLCDLFSDTKSLMKLFPRGLVFNQYTAYKLMKGNVKYLINKDCSVFVTFFDNRTQIGKLTAYGNNISVLSFSKLHYTIAGDSVYAMDIYPGPDSGISDVEQHVKHHMRRLQHLKAATGIIMVTCVREEMFDDVIRMCSNHGIFKPQGYNLKVGEFMVWFEKEL